jgi:hypothetical protein
MVRRLAVTVALAAGLVPALALPSSAAPSGGCPTPANRPALTATVSPGTIVAGRTSALAGSFTLNNCGIRGALVVVRHRPLVAGKPSGTWSRVTTVTTNAKGRFSVPLSATTNQQVQAVFRAAGSFPATFSKIVTLGARTGLTIAAKNFGACKVLISGQTTPVKANRAVLVQNRGAAGHFTGWTSLFQLTTNAKGRYSAVAPLSCSKTYNLSVSIAKDGRNMAGRSRTIFGVKPTH